MDKEMKRIIFETISEVFETMFFTFLEPMADTPQEFSSQKGEHIEAAIEFTGKIVGTVRMFFPLQLAHDITVNFLGAQSDDVEERQILDTMREALNMSVGSLLGVLDQEGTTKLSIPEANRTSSFDPAVLISHPGLCVFKTVAGFLAVVYEVA